MAIKKLTYYNFMVIMHKIEKKGYISSEAEQMTRNVFDEFLACPGGLSVEARVDRILDKKELGKEYNPNGKILKNFC